MPVFSIDSEAVFSAVSATRSTASRIQADTSTMLGQLVQLQGTWTGGASIAFQGVVDSWRAMQASIDEQLASITTALDTAGQQYAETERSAQSMFRV